MSTIFPFCFPPAFRLDPHERRLWRDGQELLLPGKSFDVLHYLLEHAGRLIEKKELFEICWPGVVVQETVLRNCLREIRAALGDDIRQPRFIETKRGHGYRFIAPVSGDDWRQDSLDPDASQPALDCVGRETELAQLQCYAERALKGKRQIVFVAGEPGMGKTTLVDAFVARHCSQPHIWVARGQCVEQYGKDEAYHPVLDALDRLCREHGRERLVPLLRQHAPVWLAQMPTLVSLGERGFLQKEAWVATRERMLRELAAFIVALTGEQQKPLLLVLWLEDLHWSDPSTLTLLSVLAQQRETARLLVIGTYRPVEVSVEDHLFRPTQQELQGHGWAVELVLKGLSEDAVAEYLARRFPVGNLSAASLRHLAGVVHRRTEGLPLFVVQVANDLVARGILRENRSAEALPVMPCLSMAELEIGMPRDVRQIVERQIDRLASEDRRILEAASVAGAEFSAAAVAWALEKDVVEVEGRCAELVRQHQFVRLAGLSTWPDGTEAGKFSFRHELEREVWQERVTPSWRQQLHQRLGERLEAAYGKQTKEIATELAVHFELARDFRRAVGYRGQAAENAIRRYASEEAVSHLKRALALLQQLPDTPERVQQELLLQFSLSVQLAKLKGEAASEVQDIVARVRELSAQVEEIPEVFLVLAGVFPFYLVREDFKTARALADQCLRLTQRFPFPQFLLPAYAQLGISSFFLGEFIAAREHFERALTVAREHPAHSSTFDWDHLPPCLCYAAFVLWHLGYPDQAVQRGEEAVEQARASRLPYMQALVWNLVARLHQLRRGAQAVHECASQALQIADAHRFVGMMRMGNIFSRWAESGTGKAEDGAAQIHSGISVYRDISGSAFSIYYQSLLAEAYGRAGQIEKGLAVIDKALVRVRETEGRYYEAELYRLKGQLMLQKLSVPNPQPLTSNPQMEAEACFLKAIKIARQQGTKMLELRAVMNLSRLWQSQGKKEEARQMLAEIYDWFTEGFETRDLREARALLKELGGDERRR